MNKIDLIKNLTEACPLSALGLPDGLYRPDLLALPEITEGSVISKELPPPCDTQVAWISFDFVDGYPTLPPNTHPIWDKLDFEPLDSYNAFMHYLEQGIDDVRSLQNTQDAFKTLPLSEFRIVYYYDLRCKAYDLYKLAYSKHIRAKRIMQSGDDYYVQSVQLANIAETYIQSAEFIDTLTPKIALEALRLSHQLAQSSLGIDKKAESTTGVDVSAELNTIDPVSGSIIPDSGSKSHSQQFGGVLDDLLADHTTAAAAQELILKISVKQ